MQRQGKANAGKDGKSKDGIRSRLIESGQLDQVVVGDALYWVAGFAPGTKATGDDEDFES
jgi:hypothetical protein